MRIKGALDSLPLCPCGASYREKCVPSGAVVCWDMPSRSAHSGTARLPHVPCIHSHSHSRRVSHVHNLTESHLRMA